MQFKMKFKLVTRIRLRWITALVYLLKQPTDG